jgi:hypothetical protein
LVFGFFFDGLGWGDPGHLEPHSHLHFPAKSSIPTYFGNPTDIPDKSQNSQKKSNFPLTLPVFIQEKRFKLKRKF